MYLPQKDWTCQLLSLEPPPPAYSQNPLLSLIAFALAPAFHPPDACFTCFVSRIMGLSTVTGTLSFALSLSCPLKQSTFSFQYDLTYIFWVFEIA